MNKEYIYRDGKAVITDTNNNQQTIDYYDNLEQVLVKKNLIETIEKEISKLEKETSQYKKESKFSKFLWTWSPLLTFTIGPLILFPIAMDICGINYIVNSPLFGTIKTGTLFGLISAPLLAIPGTLMSLVVHVKQIKEDKKQKGKETQLEYLKKNLTEQKETLKCLESNKTNSQEKENFYVSKVDNKESLKKLKSFLSLYYDLGYNEKKYFQYFKQGKLDSYLETRANEDEIQYANQHFEEKCKTLVKRKNKKIIL